MSTTDTAEYPTFPTTAPAPQSNPTWQADRYCRLAHAVWPGRRLSACGIIPFSHRWQDCGDRPRCPWCEKELRRLGLSGE